MGKEAPEAERPECIETKKEATELLPARNQKWGGPANAIDNVDRVLIGLILILLGLTVGGQIHIACK